MATDIFLKRRLGGLFPADAMSEAALLDMPANATVKARITVPRNIQHHRKFFALLQAVLPHQETYATLDALTAAMKVATGHGETVKLPDGRLVLVPGSISFAKMDQKAFEAFYDRAVDIILTRILPGIDRADIEAQVHDILNGRNVA